ncbi:MAG: methyltransferase domain-containing protein [Propionibacteriaceae bacterium]|jgi:23S rRNA (guanine745-N1)-methyltransferase|nr:methyltransferase domain-containing protein [Propionibacteriaceae bacterium]
MAEAALSEAGAVSLAAAAGLLVCPNCRLPLGLAGSAAACPTGHSFDVARQGYLNLLNGPQPRHADTQQMVAARIRAQAAGTFSTAASALADQVGVQGAILEAGAGPAYYLANVLPKCGSIGVALDISTAAARMAARADRRIAAVVADVWRRLPLADAAFSAVLCVFAPRNLPEFARVLADGGQLFAVTPNPGHLAALRRRYQLLQVPDGKQQRLESAHFRLNGSLRVCYPISLSAESALDLIQMGPNAFHCPPSAAEALSDHIDVTISSLAKVPS